MMMNYRKTYESSKGYCKHMILTFVSRKYIYCETVCFGNSWNVKFSYHAFTYICNLGRYGKLDPVRRKQEACYMNIRAECQKCYRKCIQISILCFRVV